MSGPFSHLVVLDIATLNAAPQIATFFGDLGARVIKVEHPRGDSLRQLQQIAAAISRSNFPHQKLVGGRSQLRGGWEIGVFVVETGSQLVHQIHHHAFRGTPSAVGRADHLDHVFKRIRAAQQPARTFLANPSKLSVSRHTIQRCVERFKRLVESQYDSHLLLEGSDIRLGEWLARTDDQFKRFYHHVGGFGHLLIMGQAGFLEHDETVAGIRCFARNVYPQLKQDFPATAISGSRITRVPA